MPEKEYRIYVNNVFRLIINSRDMVKAFLDLCAIEIYDRREFEDELRISPTDKILEIRIEERTK